MFRATSTSVSCIGIFLYQFIRTFQGPVHHTLRSNLKEWVSKSLGNDMFEITWQIILGADEGSKKWTHSIPVRAKKY